MNDRDLAPVVAQVFGDQSAVAVFGRHLTAQQHGWDVKQAAVDALLDAPLAHQGKKLALIRLPAPFPLLQVIEQVLGWGEQQFVLVLRTTDHAQEVREIVALGEARQLRGVVQADV